VQKPVSKAWTVCDSIPLLTASLMIFLMYIYVVILGDCPFNYVPSPWAGITLLKAMDGFCHVVSNPTRVKKSPELLVTISDILAGTGWSS